jgi:hypothetical protein
MNDYIKQAQEAATAFGEQLKVAMPKVTFNKNGYEIRAQMLELAQGQAWQDYHSKLGQYEVSVTKTEKGEVVTKVEMPKVPGADEVLSIATKFYDFVNGINKNDK